MVSDLLDNLQSLADRILFSAGGQDCQTNQYAWEPTKLLKCGQTPQLLTDVSADAILDIDRDQVLIDLTKLDEAAREKLVLGLVTHDVPYSVAPLSLADEFRLIFQKVRVLIYDHKDLLNVKRIIVSSRLGFGLVKD